MNAPWIRKLLVVGDSVTFGHGALLQTTYPYLLEQELRSWRSAVASWVRRRWWSAMTDAEVAKTSTTMEGFAT